MNLLLTDKKEIEICYINPKVDFAFEKLLGSEENKDSSVGEVRYVRHQR